jgi:glutathione S-transferase
MRDTRDLHWFTMLVIIFDTLLAGSHYLLGDDPQRACFWLVSAILVRLMG